MEPFAWKPIPMPEEAPTPKRRPIKGTVALLGTGAIAGAVLAGTLSAGAATPSSTPTPSTGATSGSSSGEAPDGAGCHGGGMHALGTSGTVTAVGTSSVTIKVGSTTTTYAVTSSSDIDKNGEASLKDLKVGDAVRLSVNGTTIDKLHAGNEALNMPQGGGRYGRPGSGPAGEGVIG